MSRHNKMSARRRARLTERPRITFTMALEDALKPLTLPTDPVELANLKAERPLNAAFASRAVRDRTHAAILARPR